MRCTAVVPVADHVKLPVFFSVTFTCAVLFGDTAAGVLSLTIEKP